MKTLIKWVFPFVPLGVAGAIVYGLVAFKPSVEQNEDNRQIAALTVAPAVEQEVRIAVKTQGEVRARTEINLVPEVSGRIVAVSPVFAEGGAFTPDTVLAKVDDSLYKLAYIRAESRVAEAKVALDRELADAAIKEKQWKDWVKDGEPTPLALNKPQVAEAQAKLRAAEADLEEARLNLDRTDIRLPFSGRVAERNIGLGQYVSTGTTLGRVFATDVVEVRLPLTDRQLGELSLPVGFNAADDGVVVPVTLSAEMGGKLQSWNAQIVRTQASIDNQTRLYYAIAEVKNPYDISAVGNTLPVGLFVRAEIQGAQAHNAVVIPRPALRGENTVYVVKDDETLEILDVAVLSTNSDEAILTSGITGGAQVVISPVRSPFNGMKVKIANTAVAQGGDRSVNTADDIAVVAAASN